jgi:hypothetical protein
MNLREKQLANPRKERRGFPQIWVRCLSLWMGSVDLRAGVFCASDQASMMSEDQLLEHVDD